MHRCKSRAGWFARSGGRSGACGRGLSVFDDGCSARAIRQGRRCAQLSSRSQARIAIVPLFRCQQSTSNLPLSSTTSCKPSASSSQSGSRAMNRSRETPSDRLRHPVLHPAGRARTARRRRGARGSRRNGEVTGSGWDLRRWRRRRCQPAQARDVEGLKHVLDPGDDPSPYEVRPTRMPTSVALAVWSRDDDRGAGVTAGAERSGGWVELDQILVAQAKLGALASAGDPPCLRVRAGVVG